MTTCPICGDDLPDETLVRADDTAHCMICGRRLALGKEAVDGRPAPGDGTPARTGASAGDAAPQVEFEMTDSERRRLAEIHRLRQIAYGGTPRSVHQARMKGYLALMIIACLLVYAYIWARHNQSTAPERRSEVTFRAFNAVFGPASDLTLDEKADEFRHFRAAPVRWKGTVAYVNLGTDEDLYVVVRHPDDRAASDVLIRFDESWRRRLEGLTVGQTLRYGGRLAGFDRGDGFITIRQGEVRAAAEVAPN